MTDLGLNKSVKKRERKFIAPMSAFFWLVQLFNENY